METWTTGRLLDAVKERMGIESDNALARIWGCTRQRISHYRSGITTLADEKVIHCAEFLGLDVPTVLLGIQAERAAKSNRPEVAQAFTRAAINLADFAKRAGKKAAAWLIFALALAGAPLPQPAQAAEVSQGSAASFDNNQNYANDLQIIRSYISGLMLLAATLATLAHRMLMV